MQLDGAYAERVVVPEAMADPIPDALSFEDAALVEPLAVAMHAVEITPFGPADTVAIVGAGPIGLLTLLAVRRRGAGRILVTDRDPHRLGLARALGADEAIDVSAGDPVERVLGGDRRPRRRRGPRGRRDRPDSRPVDRDRPARRDGDVGRQLGAGGPASRCSRW